MWSEVGREGYEESFVKMEVFWVCLKFVEKELVEGDIEDIEEKGGK